MSNASQRAVNARQLEVLKWIVAGCPEGQQTGITHKTTAVALQGRRLVSVSRKGGVWRAEATDAGRFYAANGVYPEGHWRTDRGVSRTAVPEAMASDAERGNDQKRAGATSRSAKRAQPAKARKQSAMLTSESTAVEDLIDRLLVGERIDVATNYEEARRCSSLVAMARRSMRIPNEKMIDYREPGYRGSGVIQLVEKPAWMLTSPEPIPVAATLTRPHPAVASLRADKAAHLRFKQETRQRALRVLDAIAKAAVGRGWEVDVPGRKAHYSAKVFDLRITCDGLAFLLQVTEQMDRVPHEPTAKEIRDHAQFSWKKIPTHDRIPSGRLTVEVEGKAPVSQGKFSDTKTIRLEDRVAHIVREIGLRIDAANEAKAIREREHAAAVERWQRVRAQAEVELVEHSRAQALVQRAARWQEHRLVGDYLAALTQHVESLEGTERTDAETWLTWATARHASQPVMGSPAGMPRSPEATPEALAPFMRGLGPNPPGSPSWF